MKEWLFYIVVLLANIIQGITGFAGTILAMPFGIMLVGFEAAKPVLNVLGILGGMYIVALNLKKIQWRTFLTIIIFMVPSMILGIFLQNRLMANATLLYHFLGIFIILIALVRLVKLFFINRKGNQIKHELPVPVETAKSVAYLTGAGIIHGMFVCGGPLLIGYLSGKLKHKDEFRATISMVWILLNSMILVSDIRSGLWTGDVLRMQAISVPFLFAGVFIGGKLCKIMSQNVFLILTYILLIISGISLLVK